MSENENENKGISWRPDQTGTYVVARAGDKVTCPNGHPICSVGQDMFLNRQSSTFGIALFNFWPKQGPPNPHARKDSEGLPIARCAICKELWIQHSVELQIDQRMPRQGMMICVEGEWR